MSNHQVHAGKGTAKCQVMHASGQGQSVRDWWPRARWSRPPQTLCQMAGHAGASTSPSRLDCARLAVQPRWARGDGRSASSSDNGGRPDG